MITRQIHPFIFLIVVLGALLTVSTQGETMLHENAILVGAAQVEVKPELLLESRGPAFAGNVDVDLTNQANPFYFSPISSSVASDGTMTRVSLASDGTQGNDYSAVPSISADGRYVAFVSEASNLVPGDTNNAKDIFVHDRLTGQTTRVSVASDGTQGNSYSSWPSISADGRYVAFESRASNLVPGDTNNNTDIFVHDRQTGQTTRVSVASDGTQGNGTSMVPHISADGRHVAFNSLASNLVPADTNGTWDAFIHDRQTGQTTRVSIASDGTQGNDQGYVTTGGGGRSVSADGRYVAFGSRASNLVPGDTNDAPDVFVHDRQTGQTTRISVASDGTQGNGASNAFSISADGRYVTFASEASNLVPGDTNNARDIFVHDRQTGQTTRVSVASDGTQGNSPSFVPAISADGRYVAFESEASNLVPGDTNGYQDTFVHDRQTGQTSRVSVASDGMQANGTSWLPSISANGRYMAFYSYASNLVPGDTNNVRDVFVHDRGAAGMFYISGKITDANSTPIANVTVTTGNGYSATTNSSGDYTISGLITGTYTLTPSKAGYTFSPASRTIAVPPGASGQDFTGFDTASSLSISHIEVTQVIQDEANDVPLIAGKPTFVRVYVDCGVGCTAVPGVTGTLEVSSSAGTATYQPNMGPITVEHPPTPPGWASQRGHLDKTLNFYTISTGLLTGDVTFTARVGDAILSETLPFVPGKKLRIAWVPVRYQPFWPFPPSFTPDETIANRAVGYMGKIFPLAAIDLDYFQQPLQQTDQGFLTFSNAFTEFTAWNEYLPKLDQLWQIITSQGGWLGEQSVDRLYGWVPVEAPPLLTPDISGMAYATWHSQQGRSGSGRVAAGIDIGWPLSGVLLAHEVGHLLNDTGLQHAACGTEGIPDLPGGRIDNWGIDFIGRAPTLYSPAPMHSNRAYDFMSYCPPNLWVSIFHYRKLEEGFQDYSPQAQNLYTSYRVLSVLGTVYTPTLTVDFGTLYPLDSVVPPDANRGTEYCLELRNADEILLDSRCFDLSFTLPESGDPTDAESFTLLLPYPEGTSSLVLAYKGSELARVSQSDNAPTVQLLSPNGGEVWSASGTYTVTWTASDAGGDPLRFMVSYSDNDGETWMPLVLDITDSFLAVDSPNIPGSTTARFKVTATDQMLTGEDVSDASFTVGSKGPVAFILLPEREGTIPPGLPLYLQGSAYDLEDGTLRDNSLQWSSSIDGALGSGQMIIAMLSPGAHTITLTATDSDGNQDTATLDLYVGHKLYLPVVRR
jgi:archaellum component FlaF (FlaF/FlaG flagellin family)